MATAKPAAEKTEAAAPSKKVVEIAPAPTGAKTAARGKIYDTVTDLIGGTPLVRCSRFMKKHGLECDVLAKLEFFNPMGSVKDRAALAIITAAEKDKKIEPGKTTIIEASSGNMAVSLAFVAVPRGYKVMVVMPESVPLDRRKLLLFFGAEVVLTAAEKGMRGANEIAAQMMKNTQNSWSPDQFNNPVASGIHIDTTAEEIWADTGGKADILISGVGTGATISGLSQALKGKNPKFRSFAVEPSESAVLSGGAAGQHKIQGIGVGFKPPLLTKAAVDGIIQVGSNDAMAMARSVAQTEGIPCGISAGANFAAALEVAQVPESKGKTMIVMVPSFSERYLSSDLFKKLES